MKLRSAMVSGLLCGLVLQLSTFAPAHGGTAILRTFVDDVEIITFSGKDEVFGDLRRFAGDGSVRTCDGSVIPNAEAERLCGGTVRTDAGSFTFDLLMDVDPFISWAFSANNNTEKPVNFVFTIASPYFGGPYDTLISSLAGPGTNTSAMLAEYSLDGTLLESLTCAADSYPCNGSTTQSIATPANGVMLAKIAFTVDPGDNHNATGKLEIRNQPVNVPEPASGWLLFTLGVLFLIGKSRSRRWILARVR